MEDELMVIKATKGIRINTQIWDLTEGIIKNPPRAIEVRI